LGWKLDYEIAANQLRLSPPRQLLAVLVAAERYPLLQRPANLAFVVAILCLNGACMTREALTAELAALDARRAEIERELGHPLPSCDAACLVCIDEGVGAAKQMARYPVLSAREATAQQLASGLEGVTGAPYEVSHLMDVPK
jgi:hypothetical protein